jgi:PhzF family phenazine biosynthesis protein
MRLPLYQVDAFTSRVFGGNPAGIVPLESWLPDDTMQAIAAENNLAETAFFVPEGEGFRLRWFTPTVEVDLCGHATLASAHLLFAQLGYRGDRVDFETRSGRLSVTRRDDLLAMELPARPPQPCAVPPDLDKALGKAPVAVLAARDYLMVYEREADIRTLAPDMERIARLDRFAVIVTAPGESCDFVSRFFAPAQGIPEDPVTGSAHCTLIPYWSQRLGRKTMQARQISPRMGELSCEDGGARVVVAGKAVLYLEGTIHV